ncbi:hypothetical protein CHS0354_001405 [Potamilus streckersoni]|uniref:Ankyrin repeat protein n=1 Tax=Potamilus streckersoni TaxID=2493646 RepID=A0AAE0T8R4_9BIVA|nr:hypothetical protein CHS0354_001405 [Potamilus streckersoni]
MEALIQAGLNITTKTSDGYDVLNIAFANEGSVAVIETLIEAGLYIAAKINDDFHLLHIAAANDNLTITDNRRWTEVHYTTSRGCCNGGSDRAANDYLTIVKYLIETSRQLLQHADKIEQTAVKHTGTRGIPARITALIGAGLNITGKTNDGCSKQC